MKRFFLWAGLAALGMVPGSALAHTGTGATIGLAQGFLHPLGGLDHQLAMILVGLFAWQLGGRAVWLVPTAFMTMMAFGGLLGVEGMGLPFVEIGIAASVIVLGLAVALAVATPLAIAVGVVGLFAVFHGHAHGAEMPADAAGLAYALGFVAATALLHGAGVALGFAIGRVARIRGPLVHRVAGGASAAVGAVMLAGALAG